MASQAWKDAINGGGNVNPAVNSWTTGGWGLKERTQTPSDMAAFRTNFGPSFASEADYKNWSEGQQRERTMSDFVNRMASQDPNAAANASRLQDRKSTRLNSSHSSISYAVFCLKKKKHNHADQ